ncbi:MAG: hypothetical protein ACK5TR_02905 [Alphaproteobacteria bacterium]|jgi:hypothetical protein|nr:hypothetical protein [Alphaproteobacteria bacterium]
MLKKLVILLSFVIAQNVLATSEGEKEEGSALSRVAATSEGGAPVTLTLHLINRNVGEESSHNDFWQCQQIARQAFQPRYTFDEKEYFTFKTKAEDHFGPSGFNEYGYYRYNELKLLFDVELGDQDQTTKRKGVSSYYNPKNFINKFFDLSVHMTPEEFAQFSRYDMSLSARSLRFPETYTSARPKVLGSTYGSGDFCVMYQDAQNGYHVFHALRFVARQTDELIGVTACASGFVEEYTRQTGLVLTKYEKDF